MKQYIKISSVLCAASLLVACSQEAVEDGGTTMTGDGQITAVLPATKTSLDDSRNVVWNSGDKIRVFSKEFPKGAVYSTESDATSSGAFNPEDESVTGDAKYGVYPSEAAEGATLDGGTLDIDFSVLSTQAYTGALDASADVAKVPMAAKQNGKNLAFYNLCGGICFKIADWQNTGMMLKSIEIKSNGGESIAGKASVNLDEGTFTLPVAGNGDAITISCENGVSIGTDGDRVSSVSFVAFIPAGTYASGFTFTLTDTQGRVFVKKATASITVSAGVVTPLSALMLTTYYGSTNCVLASAAGDVKLDITPRYSFGDTFVYDGETVGGTNIAASAKVVWQYVTQTASGSVVGTPTISGNELTVPVTGTSGNALVAICDAAGTILWSYHIWVCDAVDVNYKNDVAGEFQMLDRSLGALTTTLKDQNSYGYCYQWGRKDPFPRPVPLERTSGSPYKNVDVELTSTASLSEENGNIGYTLAHPDVRILNGSTWYSAGIPTGLWGNAAGTSTEGKGTKTIYDPCPDGYRVADPMCYNMGWAVNKTYCNEHYGYTFVTDGGSSTSTYPTAGYLSTNANGMEFLEYRGAVWTNATVSGKGLRLYYNNASVKCNDGMAYTQGLPVRCMKVK